MSANLSSNDLTLYSDAASTLQTATMSTSTTNVTSLTSNNVTLNNNGYVNTSSTGLATIGAGGFYSIHGSIPSSSTGTGVATIPLPNNLANKICLAFVTTSQPQSSIYQFSWFYNLQNGTNTFNFAAYLSSQNGASMSGSPGILQDWEINVSVPPNVTVKYNIVSLGGSTFNGTSFSSPFN